MKKIRIIISLLLVLTVLALTGCANGFKPTPTENPTENISENEPDGEDGRVEYEVKKYEVEDGAFENEGELNLYRYEDLPDAERVIDVFNEYYNISLSADADLQRDDGYGNWFWDNGDRINNISAAVSLSSKTGKFSFYYAPGNQVVLNASKVSTADEKELDKKVSEFVAGFEFVTGKLELESLSPYDDLYYPCVMNEGDDSEDVQIKGRRYFFVSPDYSKQSVDAQEGINCYVECGNSDITERETQYFVITLFNDGTIVSADNNITKAAIVPDSTQKMIDETYMDKLVSYFTSTVEDDTFILKRAYVSSYNNYFGRPDITPVINVEYCFKSNPSDVKTTEIALEGFYD